MGYAIPDCSSLAAMYNAVKSARNYSETKISLRVATSGDWSVSELERIADCPNQSQSVMPWLVLA